ncbi:MAG: transporter substrate-binding domain-containing protein [Minisyncoccia bacterium]
MHSKTLMAVAAIAFGVSLISSAMFSNIAAPAGNQGAAAAAVLERGTIRAGYIVYPPYILKDQETGKLSGLFYELTEAIADQLDLDVEWVEEGGYGTIFTSLDSGRYDVQAGGIWANSTRAKAGYLSTPAFYSAIYAYARADDHRFDNNLAAINNPNVKISTLDGAIDDVIARTDYPDAERVTLPQNAPPNQTFLDIVSKKADVAFEQPDVAGLFMKENPGVIRQVSNKPLRIYGNSFAVKRGEQELLQMLNVAIEESIGNGTVDLILTKYQLSSNSYLRLAPPYEQ